MLGNDRMEITSKEVTSIKRGNDIEKSTWRTHRYFVDFESGILVEISTSNWCHNFHVDSPFKIDEISTNFPRRILTSNRWRIDEDVSIRYDLLFDTRSKRDKVDVLRKSLEKYCRQWRIQWLLRHNGFHHKMVENPCWSPTKT